MRGVFTARRRGRATSPPSTASMNARRSIIDHPSAAQNRSLSA
jgi:hypothetical protein